MKRTVWTLGLLAAICGATALAQPPGRQGGRGGPPGGQGGNGGGRPPMPIMEALDSDHDGVISTEEMKNAGSSIAKLDKNQDGKLTEDELRPQGPGGPGGGGPGGQQGLGNGRGQGQGGQRGPGAQPGGGRGQGGPPGGGDGANRPPEPNPDRLVDHAMEFDADKDGKLSREELSKFAQDFAKMHQPQGGPDGGGPGGGGPGGARGPAGGQPQSGRGTGSQSTERPRRPQ